VHARLDLHRQVLDDGRDADQARPHVLLRRYFRRGSGELHQGKFDTAGRAAGVVHIASSFDYEGTRYNCLFDTEWTARIGA